MKTYKVKNYKGNLLESIVEFNKKYSSLKIIEAKEENGELKIIAEAMTQQTDGMQKVWKKHSYASNKTPVWFILYGDYSSDPSYALGAVAFNNKGKPTSLTDIKHASTTRDPELILKVVEKLTDNDFFKKKYYAIMYEHYVYGAMTQKNHARDAGKAFYEPSWGWRGLNDVKAQVEPFHQTDMYKKMQDQEQNKNKQPSNQRSKRQIKTDIENVTRDLKKAKFETKPGPERDEKIKELEAKLKELNDELKTPIS